MIGDGSWMKQLKTHAFFEKEHSRLKRLNISYIYILQFLYFCIWEIWVGCISQVKKTLEVKLFLWFFFAVRANRVYNPNQSIDLGKPTANDNFSKNCPKQEPEPKGTDRSRLSLELDECYWIRKMKKKHKKKQNARLSWLSPQATPHPVRENVSLRRNRRVFSPRPS